MAESGTYSCLLSARQASLIVLEQRPEPTPRHTPEEVTRRLRQLSKDEIEQLERLVLKMEGKTSIHDGIEPIDDFDEEDAAF